MVTPTLSWTISFLSAEKVLTQETHTEYTEERFEKEAYIESI
jgi:hypothetical protein